MIISAGVDLLEVQRIKQELQKKPELEGEIFTADEIAYCRKKRYPAQHFAARFCAKEAVFKALKSGKRGRMAWKDVEIAIDRKGQPVVKLRGATKEQADRSGVSRIHLSLSHARQLAIALVILESKI